MAARFAVAGTLRSMARNVEIQEQLKVPSKLRPLKSNPRQCARAFTLRPAFLTYFSKLNILSTKSLIILGQNPPCVCAKEEFVDCSISAITFGFGLCWLSNLDRGVSTIRILGRFLFKLEGDSLMAARGIVFVFILPELESLFLELLFMDISTKSELLLSFGLLAGTNNNCFFGYEITIRDNALALKYILLPFPFKEAIEIPV